MRNLIHLYLFAIILLGCESQEERKNKTLLEKKEQEERMQKAVAQRDSLARTDSLKQAFIKEQQEIAFDKMKFGMTEAEVRKNSKSKYEIGGHDFRFYTFFEEGKLYRISLYTLDVTANYIDTKLRGQWETLRKAIRKKYGDPEVRGDFPGFFSFEPGYVQFTDVWTVGSKQIKVYVGEESSGSTYYTGAWIYDIPTFEKVETRKDLQKEGSVEKSADLF